MPVDDFCTVKIASCRRTDSFSEADLRSLAERLQAALAKRGFECGNVFGSSTDIWMFTVFSDPSQTDGVDIGVGISPECRSDDDYWSVQVHLDDPGWFKSTRERRIAQIAPIEWAIHEALVSDLGGKIIEWHIGPGKVRPGSGTSMPRAKQ